MTPRTNILLAVTDLAGSASGTGDILALPGRGGDVRMYVPVQVEITGTLSVAIQGRQDASSPWTTLVTFTTTDSQLVQRMPQMRASYSGASALADARALLDEFCKVVS